MNDRNGSNTVYPYPKRWLAGCWLLVAAWLIPPSPQADTDAASGNALYVAPDGKVSIDGDLELGGNLDLGGNLGVANDALIEGKLAIGGGKAVAPLDVGQAGRSGAGHPDEVKGLYVTGELPSGKPGDGKPGVEFRHANGTQGVGFGYNTIYATGSNENQDLNLQAAPKGKVKVKGDMEINGNLTVTGNLVPSDYVKRLQCNGKRYTCHSSNACVSLCIQNKGRIAYKHEVFAIALKGGNHCAAGWFWNIDSGKAEKGYPMYNYKGSSCANTTKKPIMSGWRSATADCFCTFDR